ncbi:ABC transporter G member 7 [Salvia divinorum]|uniref:ABC transporter G member 7 n=1 Tax=Salvia divinorum TaxID=28513 RepID=A0ABD1IL37_SALDI
MGPSGSGKTTLLNVLAGQLAYIRQEDLFFSQLTVRETLSLAAELQLQDISSPEARDQYVTDLLFKTGLVSCADSRVGDAKVRGISGGEKKRLSLACELIASPSVIFADEPTTGLDAFQAEKVMETLRQLALDGHTVICSIHQPRGSVYAKFDDIVLPTEGSLVYAGPARDGALAYFSKFGFICPDHVNPAEFLADLISVDYSSAESLDASQKRIDGLIELFSEQIPSTLYGTSLTELDLKDTTILRKKAITKGKGGWWRQFCLLLRRAWMQASRDGPTNKVRSRMSIASAIIFGSVFWSMGRSQTSIQDRMGLLQVAAINTAMAALTKTVGVFPKERAIVDRERAKGSYSLVPYLLSKLLAEIPVGAAFPLLFGTVLYPMTRLHPTMSSSGSRTIFYDFIHCIWRLLRQCREHTDHLPLTFLSSDGHFKGIALMNSAGFSLIIRTPLTFRLLEPLESETEEPYQQPEAPLPDDQGANSEIKKVAQVSENAW